MSIAMNYHDPSIWIIPKLVSRLNASTDTQISGVNFYDTFSRSAPTGLFCTVDARGNRPMGQNWRIAISLDFYEITSVPGTAGALTLEAEIDRSRPSVAVQYLSHYANLIESDINADLSGIALSLLGTPFDIDYSWSIGNDEDVEIVNSVIFSWECRVLITAAILKPGGGFLKKPGGGDILKPGGYI
jgi:hypothetical protein